MRLVNGPIPPSRTLDPEAAGWTPLREPSSHWFTAVATALSLPFVLGGSAIFISTSALWKPLFKAHPAGLGAAFLVLAALVPVHEMLHALAYGYGLRNPNLIMGVWPRRGLAYVVLDEPVSRSRLLAVLVAPFLVLSLAVPLGLCAFLPARWWCEVGGLFLVHTGLCVGDAAVITRILSQVPPDARVHNQGWKTYWTDEPESGARAGPPAGAR